MKNAVVIDAVRTPVGKGKPGGALSGIHPVDLLATVLTAIQQRNNLDPAIIDDVIVGCVVQASEQALNIGRSGVLAAGWPESIPATTIDRQCGSGQQAIHFAAQAIMSGSQDIVVAAGVESMSRVPMTTAMGTADIHGRAMRERYPNGLVNQGISAELIADRWGMTREELDEFSARSHQLAAQATEEGRFAREIIPVQPNPDSPDAVLAVDETIRVSNTTDGLAKLQPSFASETARARFPDLDWKITPGNSSPLTDGASAVLIVEEETANKLGLKPRARIVAMTVVGSDPLLMLTGPIPATRKVLERAGLTLEDMDLYEVNEAFAPVPLAWAKDLNADIDKLNVNGGAIALGHALGSTGTRVFSTLLGELERTGGRYGLQAICEGAGMANALILERI